MLPILNFIAIATLVSVVRAASSYALTSADTLRKRDLVSALAPQLSPGASIILPKDTQWQNATERWTAYQAPSFSAAVEVAEEADIVAVVKYANEHDIPFFTQNAGHAFAPLSTVQDALMIQMRHLNSITIDKATGLTKIGGGVILEELVDALFEAGREVTVGSCSCIGAIGAGLGGGIGRLQGLYGLTEDSLRRLRVVLANGTAVNVSENENSDLWWAMRGAGHNFGVVVEAEIQSFPQASAGLFYYVDITLRDDQLEAGLKLLNEQITTMPAELAIEVHYSTDSATLASVLSVNIAYAGNQTAGRHWSDPWKNLGPATFQESIINWRDLPTKTQGAPTQINCLNSGYKDLYSANLKTFDIPTMRSIYDSYGKLIQANPNGNLTGITFEAYNQEGVRAVPGEDSAFPNREVMNVLALIAGWWTDPSIADAIDSWLSETRSALADASGYDNLYVYLNYAKAEPLQTIYGYEPWRLEKLQGLKTTFDPQNRFFGYHNIPPLPSSDDVSV